jgi:hypothetical protein
VKIYVAPVEELRKKERGDETQFTTKIGGKISLGLSYFALVKFSFSVKRLMPCYAKTDHSRPVIRRLYRELSIFGQVQMRHLKEEARDRMHQSADNIN